MAVTQTNPARELLQLFQTWSEKNESSQNAREYGAHPHEDATNMRTHADTLLRVEAAIEQLSATGRDVHVYKRLLARWTYVVVSYPIGWTTVGSSSLFDPHLLDVLELLADAIDGSLVISDVSLKTVRDLVHEVEKLLSEDESISDQLRWYLSTLTQEIQTTIIGDTAPNSFDLRDALQRLWVALYGAAGQSEQPKRWKDLASQVFIGTTSGLLASLPSVTIAAMQLTAGASQ